MATTLQDTIAATQDAYRAEPDRARARFASDSTLDTGFRCDVAIRQHALVVDEPPALGGGDAGPNPLELLLGALAACQEITYKAWGTAMGIDIDRVSVKLEGEIDLRGFFGVDDGVRAGFDRIRGTVSIESDAPAADIARLKEAVDRHCPVLDMLSTPVPVELTLA